MSILAVSCVAIVFFVPGSRAHEEQEFSKTLSSLSYPIANNEEIALVKSARQVTFRSPKKKFGDLYLFMPIMGNHISLIRDQLVEGSARPDFDDIDIHVIPLEEPDSPLTQKVMMLSLLAPEAQADQPLRWFGRGDDAKIESEWKATPQDQQRSALNDLQLNLSISRQLGKYQSFFVHGQVKLKSTSWLKMIPSLKAVRNHYQSTQPQVIIRRSWWQVLLGL